MTNFNKPIQGSDYVESFKYMTGQQQTPPRGHAFFLQRAGKNPDFLKFFARNQEQSGEGKKQRRVVMVRFKHIKTQGLQRMPPKGKIKPFKPNLWAKL